MTKADYDFPLDDIAIRLAADAGEVWQAMSDYPGYARAVWRDAARRYVAKAFPGARIEATPATWDGRDGVCHVVLARGRG